MTLGAGLLLALRAEPVLEGVASRTQEQWKTEPPPPPEPPRLPALLEMVPVGGGVFRMGSTPTTDEEITEYTALWVEAFGGEPEEQRKQTMEWRKQEEPAHRVHLSPFSIARTPVTRGQWRAVMPDAPEEWEQDGSDTGLPATHLD